VRGVEPGESQVFQGASQVSLCSTTSWNRCDPSAFFSAKFDFFRRKKIGGKNCDFVIVGSSLLSRNYDCRKHFFWLQMRRRRPCSQICYENLGEKENVTLRKLRLALNSVRRRKTMWRLCRTSCRPIFCIFLIDVWLPNLMVINNHVGPLANVQKNAITILIGLVKIFAFQTSFVIKRWVQHSKKVVSRLTRILTPLTDWSDTSL
jgi:hypothetical protein